MEKLNKMESGLKPLLSRFVDEDLLTPEVLASAGKYLFSNKFNMPFFKNDGLFDTVVYLKDLMEINSLSSLSGVLDYYEKKKRSLRIFINHSIQEIEQEKLPDRADECTQTPNFSQHDCGFILIQGTMQSSCKLGSQYQGRLSPVVGVKAIQFFVPEISVQQPGYSRVQEEDEQETEYSNA